MKKELLAVAMLLFAGGNLLAQPHVNDGTSYLMNQPLDMSTDFRDLSNTLFFADHLESFDAKSGEGLVNWKRGHLMPRQAFNTNGAQPRKMVHSDAQFAGSSSVPAHVEMMGLIGMGNNPMVGATVAVAVSVQQAADAGKF